MSDMPQHAVSSAVSNPAHRASRVGLALVASCLLAALLALMTPRAHADAPAPAPAAATSGARTPTAAAAPAAVGAATELCPTGGDLLRGATLTASGVTGVRAQVNNGWLALEGSTWNAPDAVVLD